MIGRGSGLPSATAEIEMTNSSDGNQKIDRWENQRVGRKIKDKTNYPSATVENQTPDLSAMVENQTKYFRFRHASNAFKGSEKAWSYSGLLQVLKGETKQVVNQFNPLEKSLLDQLNEENRTNPSKRRVLKFLEFWEIVAAATIGDYLVNPRSLN